MRDDLNRPVRRSIRIPQADYSRPGPYLVTLCAFNKRYLFGVIENGTMRLNRIGEIARLCWLEIPHHFPNVRSGTFVVMPNHMHGILVIEERARLAVPLRTPAEAFGKPIHASIPTIVRSYKSAGTRLVRRALEHQSFMVWQSNYFERVLRDGDEFSKATRYIMENPTMWHLNREPSSIW
jgi:putative transposase